MAAPVVVELDQPQRVAVVEAVDVVVVDVDHLRVLVESNEAGAQCILYYEAASEREQPKSCQSCQHDGDTVTKAYCSNPREVSRQLGFISDW